MLLAYLVYSFVLFLLVFFGYWVSKKKAAKINKIGVVVSVILVSLVAGFRYNVGTDWEAYRTYYENILRYGMSWMEITTSSMEPLYLLLNKFIAFCGASYQFFFTIIMLLHLVLLYKSFDQYLFLLPWGLFFYVTMFFCMSLNIQRQTLSICVFMYSLRFILCRNFYKYCICIIVAGLIHYSSFILFPVYFLSMGVFRFLDKRVVQLGLYLCSFFVFKYVLVFIELFVSNFIVNAKYLYNISALGSVNMEISSGLGVLVTILIDIILILYSKRLSIVYSDYKFNVIFRVYFVGAVMSNIFGLDMFLSRLFLAMECLRFLILAFFVYYLMRIKRTELTYVCGCSIILLYLLMYFVGIYNGHSGCAPYQFA